MLLSVVISVIILFAVGQIYGIGISSMIIWTILHELFDKPREKERQRLLDEYNFLLFKESVQKDLLSIKNYQGEKYPSFYNSNKYHSLEYGKEYLYISNKSDFDVLNELKNLLTKLFSEKKIKDKPDDSLRQVLGEFITEQSLITTDRFAIDKGLEDYSIIEIISSSNPRLFVGTYLYKFIGQESISFLKVPYHIFPDGFIGYNVELESDVISFQSFAIKDFNIFGSQLIETNINANHSVTKTSKNPKIINTMLSEFLFGSSYTILKGLNSEYKSTFEISSENKVLDLRQVQIILNDNTDFLINGLRFYLELNRNYGKIHNKDDNISKNISSNNKEDNMINKNQAYIEEIKALKELFDIGAISQEEFDHKKRELLNVK